MPMVRLSCRCRRYRPRLRMPESGSLVWVRPRLKKEPPSSGQVKSAGRSSRSTSSPVSTTSCTGASVDFTFFGGTCAIEASLPKASRNPVKPCGSSGFSRPAIFSEISSGPFSPSDLARRRSVPKTFIASGTEQPFTFSKSSAGPLAFWTRSTISPISRWGSTSALMRLRSPSRSRARRNERRSSYAMRISIRYPVPWPGHEGLACLRGNHRPCSGCCRSFSYSRCGYGRSSTACSLPRRRSGTSRRSPG